MNNPAQKQLVLQETFESCMLFIDDIVARAGDLESLGMHQDGEELRALAGEVENCYYRIRDRHKPKNH